MISSRGMGNINPAKVPGKSKVCYAKGGRVKKMAQGDLVEDFSVSPTNFVNTKDYKQFGANASGTIPLSDKDKLKLAANMSVSKMSGEGIRGKLDSINAEYLRQIDKDSNFGASMGRDAGGNRFGVSYNQRFDKGGKVNAAGNYTKPEMRKRIVSAVKAEATQGTGAGQWSARKAQLVAKRYKANGGGYRD